MLAGVVINQGAQLMSTTIDSNQLEALAQWLAKYSDQLPQLLSDLEALRAAGNLNDFWAAMKTVGDLVVPWLDNCPLVSTSGTDATAAGHRATINLGPIINALPQLISLIQAIIAAYNQAGAT
jgi:hypothetical protein